jgi:hypothetical protein
MSRYGNSAIEISTDAWRVLPPASCPRAPSLLRGHDVAIREHLADVALHYDKLAEGAEVGYRVPEFLSNQS